MKGTLEGKKLTRKAIIKINRRYTDKLSEFKAKTNAELLELEKSKMSSTDKFALQMAIQLKMKQKIAEEQEKNKENGSTSQGGESEIDSE